MENPESTRSDSLVFAETNVEPDSQTWFTMQKTIHALPLIQNAKSKRERILYCSIFALTIFATAWFLYKAVETYILSPVSTTYFLQEATELELPEVTICPFSKFDRRKLDKYGIDDDFAFYLTFTYMPMVGSPGSKKDEARLNQFRRENRTKVWDAQLDDLVARHAGGRLEKLMVSLGFTCTDLITYCIMNHFNNFTCCDFDTTPHPNKSGTAQLVVSHFGSCYRLKGFVQKMTGYGRGIAIFLVIPTDRLVEAGAMDHDGFLVKLNEPGKYYDNDAIFIPPNRHTLLSLTSEKFQFLDYAMRYSCDDSPRAYGQLDCVSDCTMEPAHTKCGCQYIGFAPINTHPNATRPTCTPRQMLNCVYTAIGQHYKQHPTFINDCRRRCPQRCSYTKYHAQVSYADFPSQLAKGQYRDKFALDPEYEAQEHLVLEMFYQRLEYGVMQHIPSVTLDQAVADIGGVIGLWIGASVIALVHITLAVVRHFCTPAAHALMEVVVPLRSSAQGAPAALARAVIYHSTSGAGVESGTEPPAEEDPESAEIQTQV